MRNLSLKFARNICKRRLLQKSFPISWVQTGTMTDKEKAFFDRLKMCESISDFEPDFDYHNDDRRFIRSSSQIANSLPKNYCFGASHSLDASNRMSLNKSTLSTISLISNARFLRSRQSEPNFFNSGNFYNQTFSHKKFLNESFPESSTETFARQKFTRPMVSVRRNQTCAGFLPMFSTIPSIDSENDSEFSSAFHNRQVRKSVSADSPTDTPSYLRTSQFRRTESYFSPVFHKNVLSRSNSSIAVDQGIDVEYDSDVAWRTKNIHSNITSDDVPEPLIRRDRKYSRETLKLKLNTEKDLFKRRTLPNPVSRNRKDLQKTKTLERDDSIASIISEVESKMVLSKHHQVNDDKSKDTKIDDENLKEQLEGRVVSPKMRDDATKPKYLSNNANEPDNKLPVKEKNIFEKCRSTVSESSIESHEADYDEIIDDVFESPSTKSKKPLSNQTKDDRKLNKPSVSHESSIKKGGKSAERKNRNSSVSIKDKPIYHEYSSPSKTTKSGIIPSSIAIANSQTKSPRGSIKKPSNKPKTPSSSDYDRDRGRSRHMESGHRESFKKNERTNERSSEQDRDAIDREHKDGSLNRSLSNTDTNLEDRIGEWNKK